MHMQYEVKYLCVVTYGANAKCGNLLMRNTEKDIRFLLFSPLYGL